MRISATWLETYRLYMTEDYISEQDVIDMVLGKSVPNEKMRIGTDFHQWCQSWELNDKFTMQVKELNDKFTWQVKDDPIEIFPIPGQYEVKIVMPFGKHQIICKADSADGLELHEIKATFSPFSADKYIDSYQWRLYLLAFQAKNCHYHVFNLGTDKNGIYPITAYNKITVSDYPEMKADCYDLINQFLTFCERKGLNA